ncbi:hypothetical protein CTI12_AA394560 [Artemisia annua]|uniref:Uncharacterized protein n=1 Tax=Artemisia annua TaxID=35608 RepID=A0A2U1LXI2_ARTAN|nr:hypothetical protein CTI12_AA394560 [Artemisia annua]
MIKELDNKGKEKATPRKLSYGGSRSAESENFQKSPSVGEAGGYSSDGSSKSGRSRSRSARRHRKSVSRRRASSKSHRSDKSEGRSRSRTKIVKSKSRSARVSRRKSSSESGYDTMSEDSSEDLSMPYKRPKPMPFTSRITRFRVRAFIRGETAADTTEVIKVPHWEKKPDRSAWSSSPNGPRNRNNRRGKVVAWEHALLM